ncbi:hypothetical protein D3C83_239750 [compost metagenome]
MSRKAAWWAFSEIVFTSGSASSTEFSVSRVSNRDACGKEIDATALGVGFTYTWPRSNSLE